MPKPPLPAPSPGQSRPPSNPDLRRLVQGKRKFSYTPDARATAQGFRGWHERGYLPHFDAPNVTQIVTVNLADAFPVTRRAEWEPFLRLQDGSESRRQLELWLDRGFGECWLRRPEVAAVVETELLAGHQHEYGLQAWVIMPNHLHLVINVWQTPLSKLIKHWKGATAVACNRVLGRRGQFWQEDYWDTLVKDAKHLSGAIRYVENNPAKTKLILDPNQWRWSSARRRDEFGRLAD
jgi:REP element-mobilizing transposase RayT